jgi:micrococcal nuclease
MRQPRVLVAALVLTAAAALPACVEPAQSEEVCDPAYPDTCIFPPPPDLNCADIAHRMFRVRAPDPHNFDRTGDGLGCSRADDRLEQVRRQRADQRRATGQ